MKNSNLRERNEEMPEKEEPTLISAEKVEHLCKCWSKEQTLKLHMKEVFSDGWTRWVCSNCGKVKFQKWMTSKEGK